MEAAAEWPGRGLRCVRLRPCRARHLSCARPWTRPALPSPADGRGKAARPAEGTGPRARPRSENAAAGRPRTDCSSARVPRQTHARTDRALSKAALCPAEPRASGEKMAAGSQSPERRSSVTEDPLRKAGPRCLKTSGRCTARREGSVHRPHPAGTAPPRRLETEPRAARGCPQQPQGHPPRRAPKPAGTPSPASGQRPMEPPTVPRAACLSAPAAPGPRAGSAEPRALHAAVQHILKNKLNRILGAEIHPHT